MKKRIAVFAMLSMLLLLPCFCSAAAGSGEQSKIEAMISESLYKPTVPAGQFDARLGEACGSSINAEQDRIYKFYSLSDHFLSAYAKSGNFGKLFTKNWFYEAQAPDGTAQFQVVNGSMKGLSATSGDDGNFDVMPDPQSLAAEIAQGVSDVKSIRFAYNMSYQFHFVYIKSSGGDYLIVYGYAQELGLEYGKLYKASAAMDILNASSEKEMIDGDISSGPLTGAEIRDPAEEFRLRLTVILSCSVFLAAVAAYAVFSVIRRNRKETESELTRKE